ncbi:head fiber protein, partial [Cetobacterium sp.]|uniref:head fiber protein n=1 Tax=Cetobacterium sp. TaxID=2071632 RepID=UPI003F32F1D4
MKKNLKITEEDLDTTPNLSTLNYLLGLIGLKDNMDMRVFSRNFIKIDKLLKDIFDGISAHIKVLATKTQDGHMSKEDKTKLDGVAENANNYKLPNASTSVV